MSIIIDVEELRREIEEDRKNLAEKEAALAGILQYLAKKKGVAPIIGGVDAAIVGLGSVGAKMERTLREEIRDILPNFSRQTFNNALIENALKRNGIRPRITQELNNLVEQGILDCVSKGQGRTPSIFRIKDTP